MPMTRFPPDKGKLGQYYSPLSKMDTIVTHYATTQLATSGLEDTRHGIPPKGFEVPIQQGPRTPP